MANQKNSVGEVQQAIKQGAITREYQADAKTYRPSVERASLH